MISSLTFDQFDFDNEILVDLKDDLLLLHGERLREGLLFHFDKIALVFQGG